MTAIDTSALIDSRARPKNSAAVLRRVIESGERICLPSVALYEWLRGPRIPEELVAQEALFPSESTAAFGPREAALSAEIYRVIRKPRGREIDIAIAATAMIRDTRLTNGFSKKWENHWAAVGTPITISALFTSLFA